MAESRCIMMDKRPRRNTRLRRGKPQLARLLSAASGPAMRLTMSHNNAHDLIFRYGAVQQEREAHENPRQIRGGKDEQAKKAQTCLWISSAPDVDQARG